MDFQPLSILAWVHELFHYLDKYYGGKTTDEKNIWLQGVIDTNCRFVKKLQINFKED